jgi:hypothetical protein
MKKTPLIFIGIILLCSTLRVHSQEFFKKIDKSKIKTQNFTQFNNKKSPTKYKSLSFKIDDFRDYVGSASKEKVINIPTPDNSYSKFLIKETSNFHPKLAEKYPMIKSYTAQGIDDPNATLSMSDGAGGIHIRVSSPDKETYFYKGYFGETEDYTIVAVNANSAKKSTIPDGARTVIDTAIKTSVNEVPFDGFNLSPNPSTGAFNLTFQVINTEKVTVQLFDLSGRLLGERKYLNTKNNFSENIFFESTSAGVYLLKVSNGNKQALRQSQG